MSKSYLTTAIDYPNAKPHIGTAFEKIGADVQARFQRFLCNDVFFLMGNDENTAKVVKQVKGLDLSHGIVREDVQNYVNSMASQFKDVWKSLDISYDDFIQTSEHRHMIGVHKFLNAVNKAGYIYKQPYGGWYCEGCEEFKLERNLPDKKCPNHGDLIWHEEENYFFKLSAFKQRLLDYCNKSSFMIVPSSRLHEIVNFIDKDLEDVSISRTLSSPGWGIPFPWDNNQVVYVWFDALLNYLTGIGFGTDEAKFKQWWPADIHFVGKDITRFHCILWPAMIMAYNEGAEESIALPKMVFGHGFVCTPAGKIGKTTGGINPVDLINKYGSDAYRYYFLSKCAYGSDSEYSVEQFHAVYNADLVNNLGNLASRVVNMLQMYSSSEVHRLGEPHDWQVNINGWSTATLHCDYHKALEIVWDLLNRANEYVEHYKPWALNKEGDTALCSLVLRNLVGALRLAAVLLKPYLPKAAEKIYNSFTFKTPWREVNIFHVGSLMVDLYYRLDGVIVNPDVLVEGKYPPLFPRKDKP